MDFRKELLKLRKRILLYTTMATIGMTTLTGCQNNELENAQVGTISYEGSIDYNSIKESILIQVLNNNNEYDYYLAKEAIINNEIEYIDIETGEIIKGEIEIIDDNIVKYMEKYNMKKDEYNMDDIETLKERILSDEELLLLSQNINLKRTLKIS